MSWCCFGKAREGCLLHDTTGVVGTGSEAMMLWKGKSRVSNNTFAKGVHICEGQTQSDERLAC